MRAALAAYVECALWSSTDESGEPLDALYGADDLAPETLAKMDRELREFEQLVKDAGIEYREGDSQLGHDFWLTRNRHGTGFWDRGLGAVGQKMTDLARPFGEVDLYVGDDGKIYQS